ncbi:EcsC family protein [Streptomyces sp. NPDC007002]|uniref:EcsC family protein n=1 Tax=Streptomyces sp. NPDC007002 TaxID=3156910 RepID=UPI00345371C2
MKLEKSHESGLYRLHPARTWATRPNRPPCRTPVTEAFPRHLLEDRLPRRRTPERAVAGRLGDAAGDDHGLPLISGGQLAIAASAGAAAAPSGGAFAGAFVADTAAVLGLASRAVGQVSLFYGYDPEAPAEKLFVMSVVNVGTASSATAKNAAMSDISRLTQALFRGKTWEVLNESLVTKVSQQFAKAFGFRLTKDGLGKAVPAFGIALGTAFNWTTLEGVVDAADTAYRRRFLLEKYPHLADEEAAGWFADPDSDDPDDADEEISLLGEIVVAGGPDLR